MVYGKEDKKFNPYGEIYTVDVAKNDFIPGKVFKVKDKSFTKASKTLFEELYAKHYTEIKKARNILSLNHEEVMDFFMKSEQYQA